MKKLFITLTTLFLLSATHSFAQTPVNGAIFTYDAKGNRVQRHIGLVLPKQGGGQDTLTGDNPVNYTFQDDNLLLQAYPNPTNTDLTITNLSWKPSDKALVTVADIQGKTVISQQFSQAKDIVPLTKLTPGTYMVHYFLNEKSAKVWRIVKL